MARRRPPSRDLERMAAVGRLLLTSMDIDDVLASVAQGMCEVSGLARSMILTYNGANQTVRGRAGHGLDDSWFRGVEIPVASAPMAARAIRSGRPQFTRHPLPEDADLSRHLRRYGTVGALVALPLRSEQLGTLGLVFLDDEGRDFVFDNVTIQSLTTFAELGSLAVQNAELTARSQRLAALVERSRAAQELHDSITQSLFGLRLGLDEVVRDPDLPDQIRTRLLPLRDRAQAAVQDMHRTLHALTEEIDESEAQADDASLQIEQTFLKALGHLGLTGDLRFTGDGRDPGTARSHLMVRMVEETLRNVARYANASEVAVHVRRSDNWWTVEVSDDGTGDPSEVRRHLGRNTSGFGLSSLQQEASRLGGRVWIREARRLSGLCVSLAVPVET